MGKVIRKVVLSVNREMLSFLIIDKKIYYSDRKFKALIRILPKPKNLISVISKSRNRIPNMILNFFNFTKEEMEEYNNAQNPEQLANIIVKDGKSKGCIVVANGDMEIDDFIYSQIEKVEVIS